MIFVNSDAGYGDGAWFVAESFSFGVEREMKESGEKGGTEDINIGGGELQECAIGKSLDMASMALAQFAIITATPWGLRRSTSSYHPQPRGCDPTAECRGTAVDSGPSQTPHPDGVVLLNLADETMLDGARLGDGGPLGGFSGPVLEDLGSRRLGH